MANRLQPLNLSDFTGGLNLRADAFQLQDNESPEMLNVDVDPRGGVRSRRGWQRWNSVELDADWSPTRLHVFEKSNGSRTAMLVNDGVIQAGSGGTFAELADSLGTVSALADTHGADFVDWDDQLYIACGRGEPSRLWDGSGDCAQLIESGPVFQNDYTAPVGGYFPSCDYLTPYQGYMVAASTQENGADYPNRVRLSHPNSPENWSETDFIDIPGGGSRITGVVAFSDHIVVFKSNSVWAIYGYDADSFTPVNLSPLVGAVHRNAIALSPSDAYFYSHPSGVQVYRPGDGIFEVSTQLRPIIDSGELSAGALDKVFLGYLNRRLWFGAPYEKDATATDARSVFVFDPTLEAWTMYRDADGDGLGPFATGGSQGDGSLLLAAHRGHGFVVEVEASENALDAIDVEAGFPTLYATKWQHAGWPALRKSWRRPDYVVTEIGSQYDLTVEVMRDYEETNPRSAHVVTVETGTDVPLWGEFVWGEFDWGAPPRGARIERGGSIGLARAVQLRFSGELGKPWGLNAVVMKFRNRRFR